MALAPAALVIEVKRRLVVSGGPSACVLILTASLVATMRAASAVPLRLIVAAFIVLR